ncbi:MAG TPA: polysaccharide deacetylase family protein [Gaiellaceae bacterium]|jgi:peptidoglycan/xylan/chitin deacetylase (PgdA/CDA1 family)|nr:polysaccharide deacetylase family protein [Gaiellaceae bacterium]
MEERVRRRRRAAARRRRRRIAVLALLLALAAGGVAAFLARRSGSSRPPRTPRQASAGAPRAEASPPLGPHDEPVPILMYHVIAAPIAGTPYPDLYLPKGEFAAEIAWLSAHGYHAVTLRRVYDYWHGAAALPRRPVVLSFDDGYRSHYTNALPVLRARGWPGVLNLKVKNLEQPWGPLPKHVRALLAAGWELDAHTITHPDLTTLDDDDLRREVAGSRQILLRRFDVPVDFFCYPSGRYDARVVAAVRAAGYLGATTTRYGLAAGSEPYTLKRVRVNGSDTIGGFALKVQAVTQR